MKIFQILLIEPLQLSALQPSALDVFYVGYECLCNLLEWRWIAREGALHIIEGFSRLTTAAKASAGLLLLSLSLFKLALISSRPLRSEVPRSVGDLLPEISFPQDLWNKGPCVDA